MGMSRSAEATVPAVDGAPYRTPGPDGPCVARVLSVCVGGTCTRETPAALVRAGEAARTYRSAIAKGAVIGPARVTALGVEGDRQADTRHHGGPDKAVHGYFAGQLQAWGAERGRPLRHGEIGENLTLGAVEAGGAEPDETAFCIGDVLAVGSAVLQVTQPRIPCYKQAHQIGLPDAVARAVAMGRSGLYLRVLQEGEIQAGDVVRLVRRPHPGTTVAEVNRLLHHDRGDAAGRARVAAMPELAESIREELGRVR